MRSTTISMHVVACTAAPVMMSTSLYNGRPSLVVLKMREATGFASHSGPCVMVYWHPMGIEQNAMSRRPPISRVSVLICLSLLGVYVNKVAATGFEPAFFCAQGRRITKLSHATKKPVTALAAPR